MEEIGKISQESRVLKLDKKDRKILSLLMNDAIINVSDISNAVELSKSNVARRISKMEESGLVLGYHAYVDVSKLGITTTFVLLKIKASQNERDEYAKKISKIKNVYAVCEIIGNFDIVVGVYSKSDKDRNETLDKILDESLVIDFDIFDVKTEFPKLNYTEEMFTNTHKKEKSVEDKIEVDNKDKKILLSLSKNCRTFSVDLAEELKLPRATITYRINKLVESGVIAKFQPNVNFFMLGVEFYFLRFRLSKPSETDNVIKYLSNTLRANTILKSNGNYQVMAFLQFKDNSEFRKFEENLLEKFKGVIQDYSFSVAKSQYKLDWFPKDI